MTNTVAGVVRFAASKLKSDSPLLDAEVLLRHAAGWSRTEYIAQSQMEVSGEVLAKFDGYIQRRQRCEPVAYILRSKEFFGRDFYVDQRVLVPRPETEHLVEVALEVVGKRRNLRILELATGSGCVATSLALGLQESHFVNFVASDISPDALDVAAINLNRFGVFDLVQLCSSDWFSSIVGVFDLIIANPPYVEQGAQLATDLTFEPQVALFSGSDGLNDIRSILAHFRRYLDTEGKLVFEFGIGQDRAIAELEPRAEFVPDLSGRPRIAVVSRE